MLQEDIGVIMDAILADLSTATDHDGRQAYRRADMLTVLSETETPEIDVYEPDDG